MKKEIRTNVFQVLSGSWLKVIAMVTMAIDHAASGLDYFQQSPELYVAMRTIGRMAFPIFAFLVVEGYVHTRSRRKYARNMLVVALISQVPWALAHSDASYWLRGNVCFTLLLGLLAMYVWDKMQPSPVRRNLCLVALFVGAVLLRTDYSYYGVGVILLLYVLRAHAGLRLLLGACVVARRFFIGVAFGFGLLALYNGQRGFIKGSIGKYLFYAFYPLHLLIIYFLQQVI